MNAPPLILASASPRRAELLRRSSPDFRVIPSDSKEVHHDQLTASELARINAVLKARRVARRMPDALVLGADTLVSLANNPFGKPRDLTEARQMLGQLQGRVHQVVTGVCLVHWQSARQVVFTELTDVRFKPLTGREIDRYLASIDPLDKAGAYAIQDGGDLLVEEVSGSYSNVVGLPLERLQVELAAWGIGLASSASSLGTTG